jgi:hypothetical protein
VQEAWFAASACRRSTPVAFEGGKPRLFVRDSSADVEVRLDAAAELEVQVAPAGAACGGDCSVVRAVVACAPPPCATPSFSCAATVRIDGLAPGSAYAALVIARDLQGFETRTAPLAFETPAAVPRLILSEVMAAPGGPTPRTDGEYVELLNVGPGAARLDALALVGDDGIVRPLLAAPPPQPVLLPSGARALAVGAAFDPGRYPALPAATPILRAATQRLLGSGLRDEPAPALRLVLPGDVPVQLATFPGGSFACADGSGLQRDESLPPDAEASWTCGVSGGTPGMAPE